MVYERQVESGTVTLWEPFDWDGRFYGAMVRDAGELPLGNYARFWCGCEWRENGSGIACWRHGHQPQEPFVEGSHVDADREAVAREAPPTPDGDAHDAPGLPPGLRPGGSVEGDD